MKEKCISNVNISKNMETFAYNTECYGRLRLIFRRIMQ